MVSHITERLSGDGHGDEEDISEETIEQLQAVKKKLEELPRGTSGVTFGKQELSLMQKILSTASEAYREEQMWRMCDFIDEEEAYDHIAAYYEAKDLGMDTSFNVAFAFALCSTNRKTNKSNLVAMMLDTLQHGKWASASQGSSKKNVSVNTRSPLS